MADTIECPYCCNNPSFRGGCPGCNGTGFIGCHNAPQVQAGPSPLLAMVAMGTKLYALDCAGELWAIFPEALVPTWQRVKAVRA